MPPAPAGFDIAAELFNGEQLPAFEIELSEASLEALREEPHTWVEGALVYRGVRFAPIGVHIKGNNSFLPIDEKPSLKIKLNHYVSGLDLFEIDEFALDNMSSDSSMMRERISYRLFREHGLPAARATHASVRINGEDRGLYALIEDVDEAFLALRYPDPSGTLWELADAEFEDDYIDEFELESGPEDRAALQAIADALALGGQDAYLAAEPWVDWAQFVNFVAATAVAGQFDSYPWRSPGDDVHLYFDPSDGRMEVMPHGMDETLNNEGRDLTSAPALLFQACLAFPACADDYEASVWEVQATAELIDLLGYAEAVQAQIAQLVETDPRRPYTAEEVEAEQADLIDFITDRADVLADQFGSP